MKNLKKAAEYVRKARSIAIAGHVNPDGDSIGSLLSLGLGLEKLGKRVYMISSDGVPKKYRKLPGAPRIRKRLTGKVDLAVTVDCSTGKMLGPGLSSLRKAGAILEIDHHEIREPFGDIEFVDRSAPAVGEMVFVLLKELKVEISKDIAQNILTSLIVETNSFRLPNVRPFTFEVCAEMVKTGLDFYQLVDMIYWSHTRQVSVLSGLCLSRCRFLRRGRLAWSVVWKKDFKKFGGRDEDVDAVADDIRAIRDVEIAIFFREKARGKMRVSLRSKKNINVARLAELYGGGGHSDVAGCVIPNTRRAMDAFIRKAEKLL